MNANTPRVQQWRARQDRDDLSLIPPLAEEFLVYGGKDTVERALKWALNGRYLLADGVPSCAHGLYLLSRCPSLSTCCNHFRQLDHANLWVPASRSYGSRPFLLSHPYSEEIRDDTRQYAAAHGLDVGSFPQFGDDWYGHGTVPIRLTIHQDWPVRPIEATVAVLLETQPVAWPDEESG